MCVEKLVRKVSIAEKRAAISWCRDVVASSRENKKRNKFGYTEMCVKE